VSGVGQPDKNILPCRTCRSATEHVMAQPATAARGMTTELWACEACGTLERRSYRTETQPAPAPRD
jgi:hypothetical protein